MQSLCSFFEDSMYIFGGINPDSEELDDLWKYNIKENKWTEISNSEGLWPRPRSGHIAVQNKNFMYIFGGSLGHLQETNEMQQFDCKTEKWDVIHPAEQMKSEEERQSPITALKIKKIREEAKRRQRGEITSPKAFGGIIKLQSTLGLSDGMKTMRQMNETTKSVKGKNKKFAFKSAILGNKKSPIIFDDLSSPIVMMMKNSIVMKATLSDKKKADAERIIHKMVGKFPSGRDGHTGQILNDTLYVFGGDRNQMAYNDIYSFPLT